MGATLRSMSRSLAAAAIVCAAGMSTRISAASAQSVEETPKEVIAVQIRRQGFACDKPISAERDREASKPNEPVWVLKCEGVTYRVRLMADMAAQVQRID
jgi:hypothetical protein